MSGASVESMSIREKVLLLIEPGARAGWLGLAILAVGIALVEAVGALLIFGLLDLMSGAADVSLPVIGALGNRFPDASDDQMLTVLLVVSAVFFIFRPFAVLGQVYLQRRTEQRAGAAISARLYKGYLDLPYEFHLERNSAELTRNCLMSVNSVVNSLFSPMTRLVSETLVVGALLFAVAAASLLGTALAVLVIGITAVFAMAVIHPRLRRLGATDEKALSGTLRVLNQTFDGIRDIRVFAREAFFIDAFWDQRESLARARYRARTYSEIPRLTIETSIFMSVIVLLAVTGIDSDGSSSLALLGLFGYAALRIMPSINRIAASLNRIKLGRAAVDNVVRDLLIVEREQSLDLEDGQVIDFETQIAASGLTFGYRGSSRPALIDVNLTIPFGSSLGIVGPTGSGKTTLLDVLLGLLEPTDGGVSVDGVDIRTRKNSWRRHIGIVPQMVFLVDDTLRRNIALGVPRHEVDEAALASAVQSAQLDHFVSGLPKGLDTFVGERGTRVSGGERQRIAIARALYVRPDLLVFDEATSALDTVTEAALLTAIESLRGEYTMITVAHRLASVKGADQIALLLDGRVSDIGTYADLISRNEVFRAMASDAIKSAE